jgi:xylulokinase
LTHAHGSAELAHAVLEGVGFGLLDGWHALDGGLRERVAELVLVGGGSRSAHWARLLAALLDRPLLQVEGGDVGAALGAARLAWLAAGGTDRDVCCPLPLRQRFEPDPRWRASMLPRHQRFRALYRPLRELAS